MVVIYDSLKRIIALGLTPLLVNPCASYFKSESVEESEHQICYVSQREFEPLEDSLFVKPLNVANVPKYYKDQLISSGLDDSTPLSTIDRISIDVVDGENLDWLSECKRLRQLSLNFLEQVDSKLLTFSQGFENLTHLTVTCITRTSYKDVSSWQEEQTKYLNEKFCRLFQSSYDKERKVYYNNVINDTILDGDMFTFLENCPNLKSMYISGVLYSKGTDLSFINKASGLSNLSLSLYFDDDRREFDEHFSSIFENLPLSKLKIRVNSKLLSEDLKSFIDRLNLLDIDEITFLSNRVKGFVYEKISGRKKLSIGEGDRIDWNDLNVDAVDFSNSGLYYAGVYFTGEVIDHLGAKGVDIELGESHDLEELRIISKKLDDIVSSFNCEGLSSQKKLDLALMYLIDNYTYADLKGAKDISDRFYKDGVLYGIFQDDEIVCGNYASMLCALLERMGIESYYIKSSKHAWSLVNLDGDYYYVDPTALDSEREKKYSTLSTSGFLTAMHDSFYYMMDPAYVEDPESDFENHDNYRGSFVPYWLECYSGSKAVAKEEKSKELRLNPLADR